MQHSFILKLPPGLLAVPIPEGGNTCGEVNVS